MVHHEVRGRLTRRATALAAVAAALALVASGCRERKSAADQYGAIVGEATPAIERVVGLRFKTPPRYAIRSKSQVRSYVLAQLSDTATKRDIAGKESAYKLLGMLPDTLDLTKLLTDLLSEQVVGFYDPHTKLLYIVSGSSPDEIRTVVYHELVHALQDQYVNLDSIQKQLGDNDGETAKQSVFEGQAMFDGLTAQLGKEDLAVTLPGGWDRVRESIRDNRAEMPVYSSAPLLIQETLLFPYLSGAEFVRTYRNREHHDVNYADMPVSTAQIIHSYEYFNTRDNPTPVSFALPSGLKPAYSNDLGEFETRLFLYQFINKQDDAVSGATGWNGDRYVLFDTAHGHGIAWAIVWDAGDAAANYYALAQRVSDLRKRAGRTITVSTGQINGRPVVLWVDVPAGDGPKVVTLANVRIGAKK